jgi:hypothetical protein
MTKEEKAEAKKILEAMKRKIKKDKPKKERR